MDVDRARRDPMILAPYAEEELFPGERAGRVRYQELKQLELLERQAGIPAFHENAALFAVHHHARRSRCYRGLAGVMRNVRKRAWQEVSDNRQVGAPVFRGYDSKECPLAA